MKATVSIIKSNITSFFKRIVTDPITVRERIIAAGLIVFGICIITAII